MNRSELRSEVRNNLKRGEEALPDSRINSWLNWSLQFIADLHTYAEMKTIAYATTPSDGTTNTMSFPPDMKDLYSVTIKNNAQSNKLTYIPPRLFDKIIPDVTSRGTAQPTHYVDYGNNFELYPIPDQPYNIYIRYSRYPSEMTADTDEPELLMKDSLIVAVATVFGFWSLREVEDATYWGKAIVPVLYEASLSRDRGVEDWTPIARPFRAPTTTLSGEWWRNPFTGRQLSY